MRAKFETQHLMRSQIVAPLEFRAVSYEKGVLTRFDDALWASGGGLNKFGLKPGQWTGTSTVILLLLLLLFGTVDVVRLIFGWFLFVVMVYCLVLVVVVMSWTWL
jgi:hypothetical protein